MKSNEVSLLKNTIFLYILVFSSYFFAFISVPYQTRILGPEYFGKVAFALAFMIFFKLPIEFGFTLSATESVARHKQDQQELSRIMTAVMTIKVSLSTVAFGIVVILLFMIERFEADRPLYVFAFLAVATGALLPDYLFRGLEKMRIITFQSVAIQLIFVLLLFSILKEPSQYLYVPLFTLIGNVVILGLIYIYIYQTLGIRFVAIPFSYVLGTLKQSSEFFYSRIAASVYSSMNTFLIGLIYPAGSSVVGLYSSAEKLITTAKSGYAPIADSFYPYMIRNKNYKLVAVVLLILVPLSMIASWITWVYANDFTALLLGEEFREAGDILRILLPILVLTPVIYFTGFPVLSPLGLTKHANYSIIVASVFHLLALGFLILTDQFTVVYVCYVTIATESIILMYRLLILWKVYRTKGASVG